MNRPCVHLICNAHLDPVWQWQWEEGCAEALATFRTAAEILRKHDKLIFNHNESLLYQWVLEYDPPLFAEIQELVRQGRWAISGGWYLQPDVNMPAIESIIRHIAEGRRFFRRHFQVFPRVAYNLDSFGHSGGLPQVLRHAGFRMYIHMRPQAHELPLPSDLYRWRGVDGSEIIGLRIPVGLYHTERDNIEERLTEGIELALELGRDVPVFWGLGDHGGGATLEDLEKIDAFCKKEKRVEIIHSTPDRLYQSLQQASQTAPIVDGDLQRSFTGCYTSLARVKRAAQESLARLVQTEALRAVSWWMCDQEYPAQELEDAWRDHLFNDFHDILPGSCIEPAERDALAIYGRVVETTRRLRLGAAIALGKGRFPDSTLPVAVINTNPSSHPLPIEVECMLDYRPYWSGVWHLRVLDAEGRELPSQEEQPEALLPFNGWRRKVCFQSQLPALGMARFRLHVVAGERKMVTAKPALSFRIDPQDGLVRSLDAGSGRECLAGSLFQPIVVDDEGDSWGTDRWSYRKICGHFQPVSGSYRMIEQGPVRNIAESVFSFNCSRIIIHTIAYVAWPVLEYRMRVFWGEERKRLKLSIPTVFHAPHVLCEVPGGAIYRAANRQEHVHGRWLMVQGTLKGKEMALAVANNGQHGFDFADGEVRLSVLRSAAYCHEKGFVIGDSPTRKYMDQGIHDVRLLVTVGEMEPVRRSIPALADWLGAPPVAYAHLPVRAEKEFFSVNAASGQASEARLEVFSLQPDNIRLLACKRSYSRKNLVLRLQEGSGMRTFANIEFRQPKTRVELDFRPYEIKTIRLDRNGEVKEVDMVDEY